jgi:hypothetical protein
LRGLGYSQKADSGARLYYLEVILARYTFRI